MKPCTACAGSGQQMVTVCRVGADGTPTQGLEMQACSGCSGTGQVAAH